MFEFNNYTIGILVFTVLIGALYFGYQTLQTTKKNKQTPPHFDK